MVRRLTLLTTAVALAVTPAVLVQSPAQALQAPVAFTSAALPTYQANGIAWAAAAAGDQVFVGGTFTSVRPPGAAKGTGELARVNFAVLDAATGQPTSCAPSFTLASSPSSATVRSLNVSPDGRTLYVGGFFSAVDGVARTNLAALDIASCSLVSAFKPTPNATVRAIRSTASTVYFGGSLTKVGTASRAHAAAVTTAGSLLPWAPTFDLDLRALALKPDNSVVLAGGEFNTVNGMASHALVALDATTGATVHAFGSGFIPAHSKVKDIAVDATGFYTANEGTGFQVFDGRIALNWSDYGQRWRDTCLGATQSLAIYKGILYAGSHAHDCSTMAEFPDGPRNHFTAQSVNDPKLLPWFPNTNDGLGEALGPRGLVVAHTASGDFMWSVGEFTTVNGVAQQSMTRFGPGPDTVGPSSPTMSVTSTRPGQVRVAWRQSLDTDDSTLTYRVYRDGASTPVYTATGSSFFWVRRQLTFTDTGLAVGSTHSYKVSASDGTNTKTTSARSVKVAGASSAYGERVLSDGATFLWRYDEASDVLVSDASSNDNNGTLRGGATAQVTPAAIAGDPSRALTLTGSTATIFSETRYPHPSTFTVETWFKTTTTAGGKLIGFGDKQIVLSRYFDKQIYMTNDGRVAFGVSNGGNVVLTSTKAYNDGAWHHVVGTQGSAGMTLYVDGAPLTHNATSGNWNYAGYWRVGGDAVKGLPNQPTSSYWKGTLDETAVYPSALSASTVADHYALGSGTPASGGGSVTPTTVTVSPSADTYANQGAATKNFGTTSTLSSRGSVGAVSYLKFSMPAAPAGTGLTKAVLRVRTTTTSSAGSAVAHSVRLAASTWTETGLTWNNRPALGATAGTIAAGTVPNKVYDIALAASALQPLLGSPATLSVSGTGSDILWFWSRNFSTTSYRPQLVLTFS